MSDNISEEPKRDFSKEKKSGLHGWFQRQGGKGKSKGWVDCNTCRTNKKTGRKSCKACGRSDGEKRGKPRCRPTPSQCKGYKKPKKENNQMNKFNLSRTDLLSMIEEEIEGILEKEKKKKDDRCTRIAKRKYDVWPSAYASGAVVKCRQGKIWKGVSEHEEIITNAIVNELLAEDDVELDESGKCTGPTKKASSTSKGKKWMKCARQPDGSYKRIHWGQKGVRVTGKSGNTKRKKSFKARHNCSNAKAGSPQAQACKDWAE